MKLPEVFIEPAALGDEDAGEAPRSEPAVLPAALRKKTFAEVEKSLSAEQATREARRCLRCDLEFTQPEEHEARCAAGGEESA